VKQESGEAMPETNELEGIHKRRITLKDGRYLIFYTFDELKAAAVNDVAADQPSRREPEAEPEAEGERLV
jgi:hypothetical protein